VKHLIWYYSNLLVKQLSEKEFEAHDRKMFQSYVVTKQSERLEIWKKTTWKMKHKTKTKEVVLSS